MTKDLRQLFDEFLLECEYAAKLRWETLRGYRATFELFLKLMPATALETLIPQTIAEFFRRLEKRERIIGRVRKTGVQVSTVATYRSKLNRFFDWLVAKRFLKENPLRLMAHPSPVYEDRKYLKKEWVERIITAVLVNKWRNNFIRKRNAAIFYTFLCCGLRRGELLGLKTYDLNLDRKELTVRSETSKSKRQRVVPINSVALATLSDYLQERQRASYTTPYLFVSSNRDDQLTAEGLKHLVEQVIRLSRVRFHVHQLRHTFAVNLLKNGCDIAKLKQLMGHTDIRMTMAYLRCLPTNAMKADVESLTLDNLV